MKVILRSLQLTGLVAVICLLSGCDDPQVYGSVGVSSGYGSYGGYHHGHRGGYNSGMRTSVSVGGRIR
ncbi:MAG: hypothetical protein V7720_11255 [Halioglobus sp.]